MTGYITSAYSDAYATNLYSSLKYYGRSTGREHKEFSKEELNVWNSEKLRKYLKERSIVITGDTRKRDLIPNVYYSSWLHLQLCSTKEQEQTKIAARRKEKLFIDGI